MPTLITMLSPARAPEEGVLAWRSGEWMRSDGRRWTRCAWSTDPARMRDPRPLADDPALDHETRQRLLDRAMDREVAAGADVVHRGTLLTVIGHRSSVSHLAHGLLTLMTAGLWGFVWVVMVLARKQRRVPFSVDRQGHVWPGAATVTG